MSKNGYEAALKGTGLFGGVQVITILISIARSKIIAIWLGSSGFGIFSLFNSTISLILSIANLGFSSSIVRDISHASQAGDQNKLPAITKAGTRWTLSLGLLGSILMCLISPLLSKWTFGDTNYTISFVCLSTIILITSVFLFNNAVIQGTRNLKYLAQVNIFGALAGFIISVPFYYFLREEGIVPSLILSALCTLLFSSYYRQKLKIKQIYQTLNETFHLGKGVLQLGIMMAVSGIAVLLVEFIIKIYIKNHGGLSEVGFFQAGWALNISYLGSVFTAMATDYFPRLSQYQHDNGQIRIQANQQAEIAILILGPLIVIMLVFLPFLVELFYSPAFFMIEKMTRLFLIGSLLKAGSWAISFIFLAKGDGKSFLYNELGITMISLPSYLSGYYFWGLEGIGYSYIINYLIYFLWVAIVAYKKYQFYYSKKFWLPFTIIVLLSTVSLLTTYLSMGIYTYFIINGFILLFVGTYSLYNLHKRIDLLSIKDRIFKT